MLFWGPRTKAEEPIRIQTAESVLPLTFKPGVANMSVWFGYKFPNVPENEDEAAVWRVGQNSVNEPGLSLPILPGKSESKL